MTGRISDSATFTSTRSEVMSTSLSEYPVAEMGKLQDHLLGHGRGLDRVGGRTLADFEFTARTSKT